MNTAPQASSKVSAAFLRRGAYLYRQPAIKQVLTNTESTLRQYDLRGRAIAFGWSSEQIIVTGTGQGHSGASAADRAGSLPRGSLQSWTPHNQAATRSLAGAGLAILTFGGSC